MTNYKLAIRQKVHERLGEVEKLPLEQVKEMGNRLYEEYSQLRGLRNRLLELNRYGSINGTHTKEGVDFIKKEFLSEAVFIEGVLRHYNLHRPFKMDEEHIREGNLMGDIATAQSYILMHLFEKEAERCGMKKPEERKHRPSLFCRLKQRFI